MLERWFGPVRNNGSLYVSIFTKYGDGWYDLANNTRVPDCKAHELNHAYSGEIEHLRFRVVDDTGEGKEDGEETVIDAHDVIAGRRGRAGSDIGYELAVDDVENLVSMGASNASMDAYTDESDSEPDAHGADSFMEVEMVA